MQRARDLNGHKEAGALTTWPGNETDKISIAAEAASSPEFKEAGTVAYLGRYGDTVYHVAKL